MVKLLISIILHLVLSSKVDCYIVYCPCMGRFGNQADQFLGTLLFAKNINRTLVLPPFIEFLEPHDLNFRPFNEMFQLDVLKTYHRVMTMKEFMESVAPTLWPPGQRKIFCYSREAAPINCRAKEGRPFRHFWDHFGIDFDEHVPMNEMDVSYPSQWNGVFPANKYPVLAFVGAMGSFPIRQEAVPLHRYLMWNDSFSAEVDNLISKRLARPFVAIHLRNDFDFDNVCKLLDEDPRALFDSAQCHGFDATANVTKDQCSPPTDLVVAHARQMLFRTGAKTLFVATDRDDLEKVFRRQLGGSLAFFESTNRLQTDLRFDLALLGRADGAVLNCVSSFSAFARRERDVRGLPTEYFGFSPLLKTEL